MQKLKVTEMNRLTVEEFKKKEKTPLIVVLDNVRSLHNVGSIFRTADAFLLQAVYLCGITSTPPNAELHKTALGAENSVEWIYFEETQKALEELHKEKYKIFAIEQARESLPLNTIQLNSEEKYAIVLGNEVKGVQQAVVDACDGCIEIPQYGTKHSLNVSIAGGIVIWEFFKKLVEEEKFQ
ncbi:RNA methyltransferase [Porphyromonadaceae sp. NP-X]|jgi:tRNA G18 (ribose-2'-O)-methylase SpoU|nr:RNA methyltransferase [Paludibacteraceae bacterium]MDS1032395.1 RNA methyltransferase [Porphyromonadaceae sp. NP-X]NLJ20271.1 RNA methyltransferase [Bacteroidales bacterium]